MRIIIYILIILIVLLGITFATLNPDLVTVHYYIGQKTLPLSLLLVWVFSIGCVLGLAVGAVLLLRIKFKHYRLTQRLQALEREKQ